MSVLVRDSISIYEALQNINNVNVIPAFQKQYVWSME